MQALNECLFRCDKFGNWGGQRSRRSAQLKRAFISLKSMSQNFGLEMDQTNQNCSLLIACATIRTRIDVECQQNASYIAK